MTDKRVVSVPEPGLEQWTTCTSDGTVFVVEVVGRPPRVYLFSTSGQVMQQIEDAVVFGSGTNLVALVSKEEISVVVAGQVYPTGIHRYRTRFFPLLATDVNATTSLQKTQIDSKWLYWSYPRYENSMGITPDGIVVYGSRWTGVTIEKQNRCQTINAEPHRSCALTITPDGKVVTLSHRKNMLTVWRVTANGIEVNQYHLARRQMTDNADGYTQVQDNYVFFGIEEGESPCVLVADVSRENLRYTVLPVPMEGERPPGIFHRNAWIVERERGKVVCFSVSLAPRAVLVYYMPEWVEIPPVLSTTFPGMGDEP